VIFQGAEVWAGKKRDALFDNQPQRAGITRRHLCVECGNFIFPQSQLEYL
jgi:hypothetical protein